ncbi:undecaprenyl-diphosphatase [Bacillus massiliigorillae]|uniref:undecaprenyl-diphosphatase n=1 Tax=Bacillus massiliigorillae TaxID=1243664 RepID=UPI0003A1CC07|nr:undecaprenyl-diphosphatase [Bacillus massiliigorillae]
MEWEWNVDLFRIINNLGRDNEFISDMYVVFAHYSIYLLVAAVILYFLSRNRSNKVMVISSIITVVISEIIGKLVGLLHSNNQPFAELGNVHNLIVKEVNNSFPSDHTMIFFAVSVCIWLFRRKYSFLWIVLAILVALSRVGVGVHYPADVMVGAIIGTLVANIVYKMVCKQQAIKSYSESGTKSKFM